MPSCTFPPPQVELSSGHGRIEQRTIQTTALLNDYLTFPHVAQAFRIKRTRVKKRTGEIEQEIVYGITSLSQERASPAELACLVRSHWAIENALHWVRDMTYDEDRCRIRTGSGPAAMASLRNFAISALRLGGHDNIARATRYYSRHLDKVTELLAPKAA